MYTPSRGDVVWLSFDPQRGHEQAGRRPAVVLSSNPYNARIGLAICCPITSRVKVYHFEVAIPLNDQIAVVILSEQVKCVDWQARQVEFITTLPDHVIDEVLAKLSTLLS
jgi:mRNA interferase MazF